MSTKPQPKKRGPPKSTVGRFSGDHTPESKTALDFLAQHFGVGPVEAQRRALVELAARLRELKR